jgi:hypothetical protein
MDFLVSKYADLLRQQLPLLVAHWPTTEADRTLQAESVYAQIKDRDPQDLGLHAESYLLLAASGVLEQYDQNRTTGADVPALPGYYGDPAACFPTLSLSSPALGAEAHAASQAAVLLSQYHRWPKSAIAAELGLKPKQLHDLLVQGICRLGFHSHAPSEL